MVMTEEQEDIHSFIHWKILMEQWIQIWSTTLMKSYLSLQTLKSESTLIQLQILTKFLLQTKKKSLLSELKDLNSSFDYTLVV